MSIALLKGGLEDKGLWSLDLNPFSAAAIFYLRQENQAECIPVPKSSSIARLLLNRKHFLFMAYLVLSPDMAGLLNDGQRINLCLMSDRELWNGLAGFNDLEVDPEDREAVRRASNAVFSKFHESCKDAWRKKSLSVLNKADFDAVRFKMIIRNVLGELNTAFNHNKDMRPDFLELLDFWKQGFKEAALLEWGRRSSHGAEIINGIFASYSRARQESDRLKLLKDCFYKFEELESNGQVRSRMKELFALFVEADSLIFGLPQKEVIIIPSANIEDDFKLYVCFKEGVSRKLNARRLIIQKRKERRSVKDYLQVRERAKISNKPLCWEANNLLLESVAMEESFAVISYDSGLRMEYQYKSCSNQTRAFEPMSISCADAIRDCLGQARYLFYDQVLESALAEEVRNIPAVLASEGSDATLGFVRHLFDFNINDYVDEPDQIGY